VRIRTDARTLLPLGFATELVELLIQPNS